MTVSLFVLLALVVFALLRSRAVGAWAAIAVFLLGFYTASTGARSTINNLVSSLTNAANNFGS
ncbi:hypothetical protein FM076_16105 [Streptomyces albus subsp. chlorinus]|uniref:hypothetical protein n=1 Tax=Streptomyces albus TaxID=1888 RepID=UPI00156D418E|nr:hypothetical protein [Streptomyces albus]NSC22612.1 hypothetical protein [Streptomyces albus subsp. chlorinus]